MAVAGGVSVAGGGVAVNCWEVGVGGEVVAVAVKVGVGEGVIVGGAVWVGACVGGIKVCVAAATTASIIIGLVGCAG